MRASLRNSTQHRRLWFLACASALNVAVVATAATNSSAVYDRDPSHLWNRLFAAFYARQIELVRREVAGAGNEHVERVHVGPDVPDPPLGRHPRFLLDDQPFDRCDRGLDEFLDQHGERLIDDPLRRVMLQRDLWAVFDLLQAHPTQIQHGDMLEGGLPEPTAIQRERKETLSRKLARVMRALAMPRDRIESLPDPSGIDQIVPDLSRALRRAGDGPWLEIVTDADGLFRHTRQVDGRSVFRVFCRWPHSAGGADGLRKWLRERSEPGVDLARLPGAPPGAAFVLLRELLCIDDQLDIVPTRIVESVQVRRTAPSAQPPEADVHGDVFTQEFAELSLRRSLLFAERASGLVPTGADGIYFDPYAVLGRVHTDSDGRMREGLPFPQTCLTCHSGRTLGGFATMNASIMSLHSARPLGRDEPSIAERVIRWKREQPDFVRLRALWSG